jgi:hypothetical protein
MVVLKSGLTAVPRQRGGVKQSADRGIRFVRQDVGLRQLAAPESQTPLPVAGAGSRPFAHRTAGWQEAKGRTGTSPQRAQPKALAIEFCGRRSETAGSRSFGCAAYGRRTRSSGCTRHLPRRRQRFGVEERCYLPGTQPVIHCGLTAPASRQATRTDVRQPPALCEPHAYIRSPRPLA